MEQNITCILHINSGNRMLLFNSWFYFSYDRHKNLRTSLFWVFRKKETFASAIVSKICYVACVINWYACMPACTSTIMQVSLTSLMLSIKKHRLCFDINLGGGRQQKQKKNKGKNENSSFPFYSQEESRFKIQLKSRHIKPFSAEIKNFTLLSCESP